MRRLLTACLWSMLIVSTSAQTTAKLELSTVDPQATLETKSLLNYLWHIQGEATLFGHHDDLIYGRHWAGDINGSDTQAVCGDFPAVASVEFAPAMEGRLGAIHDYTAVMKRTIREAYDRGSVVTACMHLGNPLTGSNSWDNSRKDVVKAILTEGSYTQFIFHSWLDNLAKLAHSLRGSDGKLIPVLFRPFHEHDQTWSWWSRACTTEEEYIALWRHTVEYLRDKKGVHNFLYVISPQMDGPKPDDYILFRWPGDDYVDFIGSDCYHGTNSAVFAHNMKALERVSQAKRKPCGVTEIGIEGFQRPNYWTQDILAPIAERKVSLLVTWRNAYDPLSRGKHFYSVFPGHCSENDFKAFYASGRMYFATDLLGVYSLR